MKHLSLYLLLAAAVATTATAQTPSPKGGDKIVPEPIALTGCVAAGIEKNTYMLSNVVRTDQPVGTSGSAVRLDQPVGTSGSTAIATPPLYWFDAPDKLKPHVGHRVEITGTLDDDVDTAEVKMKDGKVELTEGGKKVEVRAGTVAAAAAAGGGVDGTKRLAYKVKVNSVRMVAGSCSP